VGRKNAGKTTLVCDLVREFNSRGLRVATIKHTHHDHELDTPGKDSHQHREAGAGAVGILAPGMSAMFVPQEPSKATNGNSPTDRYAIFESMMAQFDLILVEGDRDAAGPRLEVWRSVTDGAPYAVEDERIHAVITDDEVNVSAHVWARKNVSDLADSILNWLSPLSNSDSVIQT